MVFLHGDMFGDETFFLGRSLIAQKDKFAGFSTGTFRRPFDGYFLASAGSP